MPKVAAVSLAVSPTAEKLELTKPEPAEKDSASHAAEPAQPAKFGEPVTALVVAVPELQKPYATPEKPATVPVRIPQSMAVPVAETTHTTAEAHAAALYTYTTEATPPILFTTEYPPASTMPAAVEYAVQPLAEAVQGTSGILETDISEDSPVHEGFAEALLAVVAAVETNSTEEPGDETADTITETTVFVEPVVQSPELPPIVTVVAEHLMSLEPAEQQTVSPILEDIIAVVQRLRMQALGEQPAYAEPQDVPYANEFSQPIAILPSVLAEMPSAAEAIEPGIIPMATTEVLEELCISLFESLGIEYQEQDVKAFMQALLRLAFQFAYPEHIVHNEIHLERQGSHEAKRYAWRFGPPSDDAQGPTQHILGDLALLYFPGKPFQYGLAA